MPRFNKYPEPAAAELVIVPRLSFSRRLKSHSHCSPEPLAWLGGNSTEGEVISCSVERSLSNSQHLRRLPRRQASFSSNWQFKRATHLP